MCAERERERQSAIREQRTGEDEVRGKQARARKRVKGTGHHKDGENERKKMHYNQTDAYLTLYRWSSFRCLLVMVTTFSSFFLALHFFSRSLFALHATSGLSSHTTLPILLPTTGFFFAVLLFFLCKETNDNDIQCNNNNLFSFIIIRILRAYGTSI